MNQIINVYTQTEIDFIAGRLKAGDSASMISDRLPGRSRNAIISVVRRNKALVAIGFARRECNAGMRGRIASHYTRSKVDRSLNPAKALKALPEPVHAEPPLMIGIMDLTKDTCRWPVGDPGEAETFGFCGHPAIGQSYCAHHHAIAYRGRTVRPPAEDAGYMERRHSIGAINADLKPNIAFKWRQPQSGRYSNVRPRSWR